MKGYYSKHPSTTANSMFSDLRLDSAFQGVDLNEREIESWLKSMKPKVNAPPTSATVQDVQRLFDEHKTPWSTILELCMDDPLCLELPNAPNVVFGRDIRKITGEEKPKTTPGGYQYSFCIPVTTKSLFSRVQRSREQTYLQFERITVEEGPVFTEVFSKGVVMTDGVFNLVQGNQLILLRVSTTTRNGKCRRIGYAMVSGESSWTAFCLHMAFQRLAELLYGFPVDRPYMEWNIIDDGSGLTKGIKLWLVDVKKKGTFGLWCVSVFVCLCGCEAL